MTHANDDNLTARIAQLEAVVAKLQEEIARKDRALVWQKDCIAELEKALEDAHRRSKRPGTPRGVPAELVGLLGLTPTQKRLHAPGTATRSR